MISRRVVQGRANPLHTRLPERLRSARAVTRMSASALSLAAGMGRGGVAHLEAGRGFPLLSTAEQLANVLEVSVAWIAYGVSAPWEPAADLRCKDLPVRLRQLRQELGLSLREVGRRAGSSAAAVRSLEAGVVPTVATLEAVAEALCVSPAWLAFGLGSKDPVRRGARRAAAAAAP